MAVNRNIIEEYKSDYRASTGRTATKFVCPITCLEWDDAQLINGHILNAGLTAASRQTVIQAARVDHFFGTRVEPSLIGFLNVPKKSYADLLAAAESLSIKFPDGSTARAFVPGPVAAKHAMQKYPCIDVFRDGQLVASQVYVRTGKDDPRQRSTSVQIEWVPTHRTYVTA